MILIVDANVLIDYLRADEQILVLASRQLGPVRVVRDVVDEVAGLDDDRCAALGLIIVEPTTPQIIAAGASPLNALSFPDKLCLQLAQENHWTCVTNDKALRQACTEGAVDIVWGLQMMLLLIKANGLTANTAIAVAEAIHASNPTHITAAILADFKRKATGTQK